MGFQRRRRGGIRERVGWLFGWLGSKLEISETNSSMHFGIISVGEVYTLILESTTIWSMFEFTKTC